MDAGGRRMGEEAGAWCERVNGESGLKGLPEGESRGIVVRGEGEEGARQEIDLSGGSSEFGLEELPQGVRRETVLRRAKGDGGGGWRLG